MAQKKSAEVENWLQRPGPLARVVLLYGPDRGLVAERAFAFARGRGLPLDDPFAVIKLDGSVLEQESGRLTSEIQTVPMFGGERLIWIRNAGAHKGFAEEVAALIDGPINDAWILIEAGDLKKGSGLRTAVENAGAGMALPCFADEGRSIDQVIDEALSKVGMTLTLEARQALRQRLGGDRLATRGEVEKLMLYAAGNQEIGLLDVEACSGDVSAVSADQTIDAALSGAGAAADRALQKAFDAGTNPQTVLLALQRQLQGIETLRCAVDHGGSTAAAAVASARPPVFFARRRLVEEAVSVWNGSSLRRALDRLQLSILESRRRPDLAEALTRQAVLSVVAEHSRQKRRK